MAGQKIALCDGNASSREIIRRSLTALGAEVSDGESPEQIRQLLAQAEIAGTIFDAALIDGALPEKTIIELGENFRQSAAGGDCRLVMLLRVDQHSRLEPYRENGFEFFLVRPIRRRTLVQVLTGVHNDEGGWVDSRLPQALDEPGVDATAVPIRVLLAEDNRINQMLAEALLERLGLDTECVANGYQAVEAVKNGNFALILMDVNMPLMDGLQATREIRALEGQKAVIPIIAMTASAMDEDRQRCAVAGMNDYIAKPVEAEELQRLIARWTDIPTLKSAAS